MTKRTRQRLMQHTASPIKARLFDRAESIIARQSEQHPMAKLQQTIGNRAVTRQIEHNNRIQRESETGIADPGVRGQYYLGVMDWYNKANRYNNARKDDPAAENLFSVGAFIDAVADEAIQSITSLGIPAPTKKYDKDMPNQLEGQFRSKKEWVLLINPNMVCPPETLIGELTNEQLLRIVNIIYHEVRHAQQYFAMARFLAGTGANATEIAQKMEIPQNVADAAHAVPLTAVRVEGIPMFGGSVTSTMPEYTEAWAWYRQVYGYLGKYTQAIYDMITDIWTFRGHLKAFLADDSQAGHLSLIDDIVTKWNDKTMPDVFEGYKTRLEGNSFFQMDINTLAQINTILPLLQSLITKWQANEDIEIFKGEVDSLYDAVKQAYEDLLTEKDAHVLGDQVTEDFKSMAGI